MSCGSTSLHCVMHQIPPAIAGDYVSRCSDEIERAADQLDHAAAFIESVLLSVDKSCFTAEESASLSGWLYCTQAAREVLR